jgi:hypothetical protein
LASARLLKAKIHAATEQADEKVVKTLQNAEEKERALRELVSPRQRPRRKQMRWRTNNEPRMSLKTLRLRRG